MSEVKLIGFKELDRELEKLPLKIQKKVMTKAVREASKVIQRDARNLAPKRVREFEGVDYGHPPGTLKKSIKVRRVKKTPKDIIRDVILPLPGELLAKQRHKTLGVSKKESNRRIKSLSGAQKSYYATWVEFGHKLPGGKFFSGNPFMRPAFDKNKRKAIQVMRKVMAKGIKNYRKG